MIRKNKKCAICDEYFFPFKTTQRVCSVKCSIEFSNQKIKSEAIKKSRKRTNELKNEWETKTLSEWKIDLEKVFNRMIRIRDENYGCVSCGCNLKGTKYDAGHFYAKTYGFLRFNEFNVHGQCVQCNQHKGSNALEYRQRITQRITIEQLQWLDDHRHEKWKPTIPEIKKMIEICKLKIKVLKDEQH
jgi:hypothetical protein